MFCKPAAHGKQTTSPFGKIEGKTRQLGERVKFLFSVLAKFLRKVFKLGPSKCQEL
ncbi:hypothetical protein M5D96_004771 [Drosophila gunungcola]|uniref:Uncharacterized protein n=1 Tax=Drosophila gunungcola TaxID=103775 RepID=A0A9P9YVH3_9MUSC|nr:hypothetical protein M5D96_004771 [Drosophila gunungcola]